MTIPDDPIPDDEARAVPRRPHLFAAPLTPDALAILLLVGLWLLANWRSLTPVSSDQWSVNGGDFVTTLDAFRHQLFTLPDFSGLRASSTATWQKIEAHLLSLCYPPVRLLRC